jgi:hypothetical protein
MKHEGNLHFIATSFLYEIDSKPLQYVFSTSNHVDNKYLIFDHALSLMQLVSFVTTVQKKYKSFFSNKMDFYFSRNCCYFLEFSGHYFESFKVKKREKTDQNYVSSQLTLPIK